MQQRSQVLKVGGFQQAVGYMSQELRSSMLHEPFDYHSVTDAQRRLHNAHVQGCPIQRRWDEVRTPESNVTDGAVYQK